MDPVAWEQAVLEEAQRQFGAEQDPRVLVGRKIHDVRLEGSKPSTELIVDLERWGSRGEESWELWSPTFANEAGERVIPHQAATYVFIDVIED